MMDWLARLIGSGLTLGLALALASVPPVAAQTTSEANDPELIVRMFYDFVKNHDCERAVRLRSGDYSISRCQQVEDVLHVETAIARETPDIKYLWLSVAFMRAGKEEKFSGFVAFRNEDGRWRWLKDSTKNAAPGESIGGIDAYVKFIDTMLAPKSPIAIAPGSPDAPAGTIDKQDKVPPPLPGTVEVVEPSETATAPDADARTNADAPPSCASPKSLRFVEGEQIIRTVPPEARNKVSPYDVKPPSLRTLVAAARNCVRSVDTGGDKLVALTFDLCEQLDEVTGYDGRIIDYLRQEGVHATLYLGGKWMMDHPRRAKQMLADPLFEIGNHGWTHGNMRVLKGSEMKEQVDETLKQFYGLKAEALKEAQRCTPEQQNVIQSKYMRTFRFPFGTCSRESLDYINGHNIAAVQWDVVSGDPARGQKAASIERTVLGQVKPGSIVVMHGNGRGWNTAAALKTIVPELRQRGYRFVTVSELLAAGKPRAVSDCYELKPGDNKGYDRKFGKGTGED